MLSVFSMDQSEQWDSVVHSFKDFDVYYLSGYVRAFELHGDGTPMLLYYDDGELRGINVVMKRDVSRDPHFVGRLAAERYYDLSTPYGYGGWLFEGQTQEESLISGFQKAYLDWCEENRIVSEFVRFHPVLENVSGPNETCYDTAFLGNTVAIKLDQEEAIWERFSSKNRGHIRKADKEGVTVRRETSKEAFDVFRQIYEKTMDHDEAALYYYFKEDFFESIRNDLEGHYTLFTAYLGDQPIASAIMLFANRYMNYHLSGQLLEYRKYAGTNKILYEAAKWGCANGFSWLHLGGGVGAQDGPLYTFKKSFYMKGEDKLFYIGRKILDPGLYDELVSLREDEPQQNFFPKYRA